ncbi:Fur family transcriptional regulator [Methylocapsa polymorpha]|uniref:Ferric uptake regulation protein n=1 Tax=Methylocapsa polymorpha TaxID=3080828 RepID=A0ABZ0HUC8_9HYPH|nr:Fur family transcriptional regulator [Methylocapsa sp. RX1]
MFKFMEDCRPEAPRAANLPSRSLLEKYGLRATRQRLGLAKLLFSKGDRHLTADALAVEAHAARIPASLATIYNVLNLFAQVGLVRSLPIEGAKTVFDTNTSDHSHFFFEDTGEVCDISAHEIRLAGDIEPPDGYEIVRVDVVVRLRPKMQSPVAIKA